MRESGWLNELDSWIT